MKKPLSCQGHPAHPTLVSPPSAGAGGTVSLSDGGAPSGLSWTLMRPANPRSWSCRMSLAVCVQLPVPYLCIPLRSASSESWPHLTDGRTDGRGSEGRGQRIHHGGGGARGAPGAESSSVTRWKCSGQDTPVPARSPSICPSRRGDPLQDGGVAATHHLGRLQCFVESAGQR